MDTKSYCAKCKQEVPNDIKEHACGCRVFLFGNLKLRNDGNLGCACGNDKMKFCSHVDFTDKATWTYQCTQCGAVIGKEYFRDAEDIAYWGE